MWTVIILGLTVSCGILLYFYIQFKRTYKLWSSQGVPTLSPLFPIGNLDLRMAYTNFGLIASDFYRKLKPHGDYAGLFFLNKPVLFVLSPEFAKIVLVRDFQHFMNRGVYFNKEDDPLSANLFFIENNDWRRLRTKMTPAFTSNKIKMMFHTIYDVGIELVRHLQTKCDNGNEIDVEITDVMARYNTDVIVSCAFGTQCNSLANSQSEFRAVGKKMLAFTRIRLYKLYGAMLFRTAARAMGFRLLHEDVSTFIISMCKKTIEERKAKKIERRDFMQLMIDLYKENSEMNQEGDGLSLNEIAAQVFVFFFAGFETSSTAMTYALYELALNPDVQDKLRTEINDMYNKSNQEITYESIMEMTYLDQVIYGKYIRFQFHFKNVLIQTNFELCLHCRNYAKTSGCWYTSSSDRKRLYITKWWCCTEGYLCYCTSCCIP